MILSQQQKQQQHSLHQHSQHHRQQVSCIADCFSCQILGLREITTNNARSIFVTHLFMSCSDCLSTFLYRSLFAVCNIIRIPVLQKYHRHHIVDQATSSIRIKIRKRRRSLNLVQRWMKLQQQHHELYHGDRHLQIWFKMNSHHHQIQDVK